MLLLSTVLKGRCYGYSNNDAQRSKALWRVVVNIQQTTRRWLQYFNCNRTDELHLERIHSSSYWSRGSSHQDVKGSKHHLKNLDCLVLCDLHYFDAHQRKLEQRHNLTSNFPYSLGNIPRFYSPMVFVDRSYNCNHHFHQHNYANHQFARLTVCKLLSMLRPRLQVR
jgi:hypothetical protein